MAQESSNNPVGQSSGWPTENDREAVDTLARLIAGYQVSQVIYVAAELKLADWLEAGPKTSQELADLTRVNPEALYRVMRALASVNIFEEIAPRRFALTHLGQLLRIGVPGSLRSTALFNGSPRIWQTWHELL